MKDFDYWAEAELFLARRKTTRRQPIGYARFARAADALRHAIETIRPDLLLGAYMEVNEQRYDHRAIRCLYDSVDYPLPRCAGIAVEEAS